MTSAEESKNQNDPGEEARRELAREVGRCREPASGPSLPSPAPRVGREDSGHKRVDLTSTVVAPARRERVDERPASAPARPAPLGTYCGNCNSRETISAAEMAAVLGCPNVIAPEGYCGFVNRDIKFSGGGHERAHRMAAYRGSSHLGGIHHDPD